MREYKLYSAPNDVPTFHIARLNCSKFNAADLQVPVHLYRGNPDPEEPKEATTTTVTSSEAGAAEDQQQQESQQNADKKKFKRKTRLFYNNTYYTTFHQNAEDKLIHKREHFPWILEDSEDTSFVGKLDAGNVQPEAATTNYVFFIFENGKFNVVHAKNWYKFHPRVSYRTLTTDEAEEHLKKKTNRIDRWMMHNTSTASATTVASSNANSTSIGKMKLQANDTVNAGGDVNELLYEEEFDDDDDYFGEIDEDEHLAMKQEKREKEEYQPNLSMKSKGQLFEDSGDEMENQSSDDNSDHDSDTEKKNKMLKVKQTKKLLKKMNLDFNDNDEEEDPYANSDGELFSESDSEDDKESAPKKEQAEEKPEEKEKKMIEKKEDKQLKIKLKPSVVVQPIESTRNASPGPEKKKRPVSPNELPSKKQKLPLSEESLLLVFRRDKNREWTPKDILKAVGSEFFGPEGRELLKASIRKFCVKAGSKGDEKVFKLKKEFF